MNYTFSLEINVFVANVCPLQDIVSHESETEHECDTSSSGPQFGKHDLEKFFSSKLLFDCSMK